MKSSTLFHKYKEVLLGVFMLALAGIYLYATKDIKTIARVRVDARFIPMLLWILVAVLGVLQLIAGFRNLAAVRRADRESGTKSVGFSQEELRGLVPILLTFVIIFGYVLAFDPLGFVVSSSLCMFLQMLVLTPKGKMNPLLFAAVSVVMAIVVYIAFRKGLDLSLPEGILEGIL